MSAIRSIFELTIKGEDAPADTAAFNDGVTTSKIFRKVIVEGTSDDQMGALFKADTDDAGTAEIGTSATVSIDFQTALDPYGVALAAVDMVMLYIEHKATSSASSIQVEANAADGWTNLLGTAAAMPLAPGEFAVWTAFDAATKPITGTNKVLDLVNQDGSNTAAYVVEAWLRR